VLAAPLTLKQKARRIQAMRRKAKPST
jgi:hypothetical protein